MPDRDLLADVAPVLLFAIAAVVFFLGASATANRWVFGAAVLAGLGAFYQLYRLGSLYIE